MYFQTLDLIKFLMCPVYLNMGTISGMTHIKMTFSLSPGTDKHFIGNSLCSSENSVMQFIHILYIFTINNVFYKLLEEKI
jgi:hypothetical protein